MLDHLKATGGSSADFAGPVWSAFLWFDIDRDDLAAALADGRRLATVLLSRYAALAEDDLALFFSGKKGVHVGLPLCHAPNPGPTFHRTCRVLAGRLARLAGVAIDAGIYDRVRPFRLPNSRHPKTGLHKVRLEYRELMHLSPDAVRNLAREPRPFEVPDPPRS